MKHSLLLASAITLAMGPIDLPHMIGAPSFAPSAQAAVIIGNRNRLKERPRVYRSQTIINRTDIADTQINVFANSKTTVFSPDGEIFGPFESALEPGETSTLSMSNPTFVGGEGAATNVLSGLITGGSCEGTEFAINLEIAPRSQSEFAICETITGKSTVSAKGKQRITLRFPTDEISTTALYGMILIDGEPLEMERIATSYSGTINGIEPGAISGFTYEQTITSTDQFGTILSTQTVRGTVGGDETVIDPEPKAAVIIGNRNRIKRKPRRNYTSVHVTRETLDGPDTGVPTITITATPTIVYTDVSGQRTVPPITPTAPARQVLQFEYDTAGDDLPPGTPIELTYLGQTFQVPLDGIDSDEDGEIDDMSGTPIPGTDLTARIFSRNGGPTKVIRIKGTVVPRPTSGSPAPISGPANNKPPVLFNIWEGEIKADPRTFDGQLFEREVILKDAEGTIIDRVKDEVTLDPPEAGDSLRSTTRWPRRSIRIKARRKGGGFRVVSSSSSGGGETTRVYAQIALSYANATDQGELRTTEPVNVLTASNSTFTFEHTPAGESGLVDITPGWCGLDIGGPITLNESQQFGAVNVSMTERGNGNYRVRIKGPGEAFPENCAGAGTLTLDGLPAYDRGRADVWDAEFPDIPDGLPTDTVFFVQGDLINADTEESIARFTESQTANDAPRNQAQLSYARFDRGIQAIVDGRIVAEGFTQDETPALAFAAKDGNGNRYGGVLTTHVCHLFEAPGITFGDPDSVLDMQYLVELSVIGEDGGDLAYIEHEVIPTESPDDVTAFGQFGQQIGMGPFDSAVMVNQNADGETYGMTVSLCGQPANVKDVAVFMTPLDGGSDPDPEDFTMDFIEKDIRADVSVNSGSFVFGETVYVETRVSATSSDGKETLKDIRGTTLELIGDDFDWDSLDIRGPGETSASPDENQRADRRVEVLKAQYQRQEMRDIEG